MPCSRACTPQITLAPQIDRVNQLTHNQYTRSLRPKSATSITSSAHGTTVTAMNSTNSSERSA